MVEAAFHRLFLAVRPPDAPVQEIAPIRDWFAPRRPVPDPQLHLTLLPFPVVREYPDALAERLVETLSRVEMPAFRVIVERLVVGNGRALLQPNERVRGLHSFQRRLAAAVLADGSRSLHGHRFSPHLTLFYGARPDLTAAVDPISWTAEELVLVHSLIGRSEHRTIARWPLGR